MSESKIQWTEKTWNPIGGCFKVSPGCKNCYAIRVALRLGGNPNAKIQARYEGLTVIQGGEPNWSGRTFIDEEVLQEPLKTRKPTTYFISLSDLFYTERSDDDIDRVFAVMALASRHRFLILTKYHERMREYFGPACGDGFYADDSAPSRIMAAMNVGAVAIRWPLPNLALGVSVEDYPRLNERPQALLRVPAAMRFLSLEPLLEDLGTLDLGGINWVIVGGESGPGSRPCDVAHVRSVVAQCQAARVPVFVKQLGRQPSDAMYEMGVRRLGDKKGGDMEEWPADLRVREYPSWMGRSGS